MTEERERRYPIAEIFDSIQGEGHWVGVPMTFLRFSGCSVGRYDLGPDQPPICQTFAGAMTCDTNYRVAEKLTLSELLDRVHMHHVCLTGGEPADHDLDDLVAHLQRRGLFVHLETSGTKFRYWMNFVNWIACSPKRDFNYDIVSRAHELRFLVSPVWGTVEEQAQHIESILRVRHGQSSMRNAMATLFLSPVNPVYEFSSKAIDMKSLEFTLEVLNRLQLKYDIRLSVQLHKFLDMR